MAENKQCEFFLLRYVPDAVKDEFVNIGLVLRDGNGFAEVRFAKDFGRVKCLDPAADLDMLRALEADVKRALADSPNDAALVAKMQDWFSGTVQLSPTKAVLAASPPEELKRLAAMYLETAHREPKAREATGRVAIVNAMRSAFEAQGVWQDKRAFTNFKVAKYTQKGDPLKLDFGYRPNGNVRFFHAVALAADPNAPKVLAFSFPQVREGIARGEKLKAELTAVVESDLDRADEATAFAFATLASSQIAVSSVAEMPRLAEAARKELRL